MANHCVRAGASGDGSSWDNAFAALPSVLERGDTYYIADGSYAGYDFDDAESDTDLIAIKKATEADHGVETGWASAYGDGVATFTGQLWFSTDYYVLDGVVGSGRLGHGFRVAATGASVKQIRATGGNHITIAHVEAEGPGIDQGESNDDIVYLVHTSPTTYWTLQYCWLHNTNRTCLLALDANHITVEHCVIEDRHTDGSVHGELFSINSSGADAEWAIRHNIFANCAGTGFVVIKDSTQSGFKIYGNLFYQSGAWGTSNGAICDTSGDVTTDVIVYNNTFVDIGLVGGGLDGMIGFNETTGNYVYNNIAYNCRPGSGAADSDYNLYNDSDDAAGETNGQYWSAGTVLFTDYGSQDFTLDTNTAAGTTLSSEYATDSLDNTRGADGLWDRGAYEYGVAGEDPVADHYVDTGATGTGDGSSWTDAWTSMAEMIAEIGVLTEDSVVLFRASTAADDTTPPVLNNVCEDFKLTMRDYDGTYKLVVSNASALIISDERFELDGLWIETAAIDANYQAPIQLIGVKTQTVEMLIKDCVLKGANSPTIRQMGIYVADADVSVTVENTLIWNISTTQGHAFTSGVTNIGGTITLYNCVIQGGSYSLNNNSGTMNRYNCVEKDAATAAEVGTIGGTNNASNDTGLGGSSNQEGVTFTDYFTDAANGDVTLTASATALLDNGIGPSADANVPTPDAAGTTRSGATCDIGAYEYIAGATTYVMAYDANGGTGTVTDASSPYEEDEVVTVLDPADDGDIARSGYRFVEWNTAANGSGTAYDPDDGFSMPAANVTLYAQWVEVFTVTYDGNTADSGDVPTDSETYAETEEVAVLGNTGSLVKDGYEFAGWNTQADGEGTGYDPDDIFEMPGDDVTLYAVWVEVFTVTYDGNTEDSGDVPVDASSPYTEGETVTVLGNTGDLAKDDYVFSHWNTAANGSGTDYNTGATFNMPGEDVTLYAQWAEPSAAYGGYSPFYKRERVTKLFGGGIS